MKATTYVCKGIWTKNRGKRAENPPVFVFAHMYRRAQKAVKGARNCILLEPDRLRAVYSAGYGAIARTPSEPTCKKGKAYLWRLVLWIKKYSCKQNHYNNHLKKAKPRFCLFPSICRTAFEERVNLRDLIICVPWIKTGSPKIATRGAVWDFWG